MRYPALESLRGVAALIVVVHHHLLVFPSLYPYNADATGLPYWLLLTPIHLIWAGGEAVIFFFLLSGFVLTLPTWRGQPLDMQDFMVRRVWRIWVPLISTVCLAWGAASILGASPIIGASIWFNQIWVSAGPDSFIQHLLMLGNMDSVNSAFIPVVWSLKWEMWGSLLLPVVIILARQRTMITVVIGVMMLVLYWQYWHASSTEVAVGLLRYLPMFVAGAWLARHHEAVTSKISKLPTAIKLASLLLALLMIPVQWYGWHGYPSGFRVLFNDVITIVAAMMLISLALGWEVFRTTLEHSALMWLGKISFSLYLFHSLVLAIVVRLGSMHLPLSALVVLSFLLTLPVAHLAYRLIEQPALNHIQALRRRPALAAD